eukprot:9927921-Lingulodinium_polyedra.AAC.1
MARGRWRAPASTRRYAKSGRVQQFLSGLEPAGRAFCEAALASLPELLAGARRPAALLASPKGR